MVPVLRNLENESVYIIRTAIEESENPLLLYSTGKDSAGLLHPAFKAFYPARLHLSLLHIGTTRKFKKMAVPDNLIHITDHPESFDGLIDNDESSSMDEKKVRRYF